jgi:hypothetical protein
MGASPQLRWVAIVAAMWLATAVPALAQSSAGPDPAPSGSQSPSPDPAPVKAKPARPVVKAVTTVRPPVQSTTPAPASPPATKPAQHKSKKPARHQRKRRAPAAAKHRTVLPVPSLPHLNPARLVAPQTTDDAGRARKLAAGALSLLVLALASATLLAFTARVERRRVVR